MKLIVDGASCTGHDRCYRIAADLLTYDDEGYPTTGDELINVPDDQVEDAAGTCPEEATSLIPK